VLPIPKTNAEKFPEVKKLLNKGLQSIQYTFSADNASQAGKLYRGASPSDDGTELSTAIMPDGFPMTIAPERREEFSPGLDKELLSLIQATAEIELDKADAPGE
jgi:Mn-containing catalase